MRPARFALAVVSAVAALSGACASYVEGRVESALLEAMPRVIGPADRYQVTVRGADASASHFDRVHATGERVRRPRAPVIDRFDADLEDVSVDRANNQVIGIGSAQARIRVKGADLTAFLEQQRWIAQARVQLLPPDRLRVSGLLQVPGLGMVSNAPASFEARLIPDGPRLLVEVSSLSLGNQAAPSLLRGLVQAAINPLFDLSTYAVPSIVDRVGVDGDAIVLDASGSQLVPRDRRRGAVGAGWQME